MGEAIQGETIELSAADGHRLGAYLARPAGAPKAGLVVVQEIFGVNRHIRAVTDGFAGDGYLAIAPALFDRRERGRRIRAKRCDSAPEKSRFGSAPRARSVRSVRTSPGQSETTAMPDARSSWAVSAVSRSRAHFPTP